MFVYPFMDEAHIEGVGKRRVEGVMNALPLTSEYVCNVFYTKTGHFLDVIIKEYGD